jgi:tol-pal system protein YbgF
MKKILRNILIVLAVLPFLAQCASQDDVNRLNYQLRIVNKKIDDMKTDTVGNMQKRQAASSGQIDQLQSDIQNLRGQLEEMAHTNRTLTEQNKELSSSLQSYTTKSTEERDTLVKQFQDQGKAREEQISELTQKLNALQASKLKEAERRAREASRRAEEARARANSAGYKLHKSETTTHITADKKKTIINTSSQPQTVSVEKKVSPSVAAPKTKTKVITTTLSADNDIFNLGMADYKKGNYSDAFKQFEKFTKKNETGDKSIEARYMMGECLFEQKDYDQAILQYQKIVSDYPQSAKAPEALLRQGLAFERLHDKDTARIIYKKIMTQYGNSREAATAKQRAAKL